MMQPYESDPYWQENPQPYGYPYPPAPHPMSGTAITSLVLGILAVMFCWIPVVGLVAWPLCLLGGGFGVAAMGPTGRGVADGRGLAVAGLVCSAVALAVCVLYLVAFVAITA
jgi:hypothetical protein